jgi:hypothetical protein
MELTRRDGGTRKTFSVASVLDVKLVVEIRGPGTESDAGPSTSVLRFRGGYRLSQ